MYEPAIAVVVILEIGAVASIAHAEDKFQKLNGAQIQTKLAGMEMTDQVHWGDVYQRNGVLITTEMGPRQRANGTCRRISFASIAQTSWAVIATRCGSRGRTCSCAARARACRWRACSSGRRMQIEFKTIQQRPRRRGGRR